MLEDGFAYAGTVYSSLTKIAQAITGAHWSGPRFFGLIDKGSAQSADDGAEDHGPPAAADEMAGGANG